MGGHAGGTERRAGGIYVHFPYCERRCHYCDFNVVTPRRIQGERYADAVTAELRMRASQLTAPARSLYVGGGTPSLWAPADVARVIAAARAAPGLAVGAEVTLEANPAELTAGHLQALRDAGVNRLSLGVQSLSDAHLAALDRRHDAAGAAGAIARVAAAGFDSFSVDFMFGLPGQTLADWEEELARVVGLGAPHLSVYGLTVEPRTVLAKRIRQGRVTPGPEEAWIAMLFAARRTLRAAGYAHYEVSNYARPGHRAVHNSGYWELRPYLGVGAGAHGFVPPRRWWNLARPRRYFAAVEAGERPEAGAEELDAATASFERIMTGLRRLEEGVDLGADEERYAAAVAREVARGRLRQQGRRIWLTEDGLRWMNDVLVELHPGA